MNEWGWEACDGVEAMIIGLAPGIDTLMIETPDTEGHVKLVDWEGADRQDEIDAIWNDFVEGSKAQSEAVGVLAALVGVKYGKATAGFIGMLLLLLKKGWFVLLIPFIFLKKFLTGKKEAE